MIKKLLILFVVISIFSCKTSKTIEIKKVNKEDARKSVRLFHDTFPDIVKSPTGEEINVSDYHTVYGVFFSLIDSNFIQENIQLKSNELKIHYPDLNFKKIKKEFNRIETKNPNIIGCRIYQGFKLISEKNHPFESENYLVFVEYKGEKDIKNRLYDNLNEIYKIKNQTFDLREFSELVKPNPMETKNYHLSCAPNCPKPDLISEN